MSPSRVELSPGPTSETPPGLKLIPEDKLDPRSDEEIAEILVRKRPVTSEKNIWSFWHSGYKQMPPWLRRNAIDWVRRLGPEWNVHVLDSLPGSETNARNYLEPELLPEAFNKDIMDGRYKATHSSDIIRLALLWKYGGIWMDMGSVLFRHAEHGFWSEIEDPNSPYEIAGFVMNNAMVNGFIACRKGNSFVKRWHDAYLKLWEGGATNCKGFHEHPVLQDNPRFPSPSPQLDQGELNDYLAHSMCLFRTQKLVEDDFNGPEYFAKHTLLIPALEEMFLFQTLTEWDGKQEFELLATKRTGEGVIKDETWDKAEDVVHKVLANSCLMKLSHGPAGLWESTLADFWDSEEHADADIAPGSFAAYMRHASVRYDQTRKLLPFKTVSNDVKYDGLMMFKRD